MLTLTDGYLGEVLKECGVLWEEKQAEVSKHKRRKHNRRGLYFDNR